MAITRKKKTSVKRTPKKRHSSAGEWQPAFLASLRNTGNVRLSCQAAGIARSIAYVWRDSSLDFRKQWEEAMDDAIDILEAVATERARSSSDTLVIFLLKAHRPEKYRDRWYGELTGASGGPLDVSVYIPDNGRDLK